MTLNVRALLGAVAQDQGRGAEASAHYRAVLERAAQAEAAERPVIATALALALRAAATQAAARGDLQGAARLAGAAAALQRAGTLRRRDPLAIRLSFAPADEAAHRRLEDELRTMLGAEALEVALEEGRALDARTALRDALGLFGESGCWVV